MDNDQIKLNADIAREVAKVKTEVARVVAKETAESQQKLAMALGDYQRINTEEHRVLKEVLFGNPSEGELGMVKKMDIIFQLYTGGNIAWRLMMGFLGLVAIIGGIILTFLKITGK